MVATHSYNAFGQLSQTQNGTNSSGTVPPVVTYVPAYERYYAGSVYRWSDRITSWTVTSGGNSAPTTYAYDSHNNITSASDGTYTTTYAYDGKDQLIRENNQAAGKTWTYTYDNGGNILSKTEYAYTTGDLGTPLDTITYTYGDSTWKDLLTAYDGQPLTYDAIGNLTDDGTWAYTWQHGRQLAGMTDGTTAISYAYNADGQRISKTVDSVTYNYVYAGSALTDVTWGSNSLHFVYDALGASAVIYNGTTYYYLRNAQGDIVGIVDSTGTQVVAYSYDVWGKLLTTTGTMATTLGVYNPLRYRGYVYDTETGLYYLTSRYYNPSWGRFINADGYVSTGQGFVGCNMFAYCGNSPVMHSDPNGLFWKEIGDWFKRTFGASATVVYQENVIAKEYMPMWAAVLVSVKSGKRFSTTVSTHGNDSKPISVYAQGRVDNPLLSSAGIKVNISTFSINLNLGLDDISISGSVRTGNTTTSIGLRVDLANLKVGIEQATTVKRKNTNSTTFVNYSVTGIGLAAAYAFVTTGQSPTVILDYYK